jgi:hypothetical protein
LPAIAFGTLRIAPECDALVIKTARFQSEKACHADEAASSEEECAVNKLRRSNRVASRPDCLSRTQPDGKSELRRSRRAIAADGSENESTSIFKEI